MCVDGAPAGNSYAPTVSTVGGHSQRGCRHKNVAARHEITQRADHAAVIEVGLVRTVTDRSAWTRRNAAMEVGWAVVSRMPERAWTCASEEGLPKSGPLSSNAVTLPTTRFACTSQREKPRLEIARHDENVAASDLSVERLDIGRSLCIEAHAQLTCHELSVRSVNPLGYAWALRRRAKQLGHRPPVSL